MSSWSVFVMAATECVLFGWVYGKMLYINTADICFGFRGDTTAACFCGVIYFCFCVFFGVFDIFCCPAVVVHGLLWGTCKKGGGGRALH